MFKVGQRVVCVRGHSRGVVRVGQEFVVFGVSRCVGCGCFVVNVGICGSGRTTCNRCLSVLTSSGIHWLDSCLFAPIEEISETTYEDILKPMEAV